MTVLVRPAEPQDAALICEFLWALAEQSELPAKVGVADVSRLFFGAGPHVFSDIAMADGEAIGFSTWFYDVDTFAGAKGIHLEDLYVRPQARGSGAGLALMSALARRCRDEGLASLEWSVLPANASALAFYGHLGATPKSGWITQRLWGAPLAALADR